MFNPVFEMMDAVRIISVYIICSMDQCDEDEYWKDWRHLAQDFESNTD